MQVSEVAAASAGNQDLLADAIGMIHDENFSPTAPGFHRAHQSSSTCSKDENVEPAHANPLWKWEEKTSFAGLSETLPVLLF